jgi:hypothetical protein
MNSKSSDCLENSREAAQDSSPRRKPWVKATTDLAPKGRKKNCDTDFLAR